MGDVHMDENIVYSALPDWPRWAIHLLFVMAGLLTLTFLASRLFTPEDEKNLNGENDGGEKSSSATTAAANGADSKHHQHHTSTMKELHVEFNSFRREYISVYLIIMLADWMQGTHMYTLYLSYGVNISALFLTGFLSGAIFAPFLGSAVDKFGRKKSCVAYCILEIIINVLEHSTNFRLLLFGRVLGGVSTNLLFSAFESWMTTEHRNRGFPEQWLARTYSDASVGNGAAAILAGIAAQILEDYLGHIGPFQGAVALTLLALILVMRWPENYGEERRGDGGEGGGASSSSSLGHQFKEGWKVTLTDSRVWRVGMTQALSEGAMYTFVFMWVPTLLSMDPPGGVPTGCVFSSLMMAITIGGILFQPLESFVSKYLVSPTKASELSASLIYALASASMAVPAYCMRDASSGGGGHCFEDVLASFMVVEMCVGLFMPVAGTLRSKYVPDALQGGILNIFRLPLNVVVVAGTYATDVLDPAVVFVLVSACFMGASILQATMIPQPAIPSAKKVD